MSKADASLKLSLERLEQTQPEQMGFTEDHLPPSTRNEVERSSVASPQEMPRGSLFSPSADVFDQGAPAKKAEPAEEAGSAETTEPAETTELAEKAEPPQETKPPEKTEPAGNTEPAKLSEPAAEEEPDEKAEPGETPTATQEQPPTEDLVKPSLPSVLEAAPQAQPPATPSTAGSKRALIEPEPTTPASSEAVDPTAAPPHLAAPPQLLREDREDLPAREGLTISRHKFVGTVAAAALLSALLTYFFTNKGPTPPPPPPQLSELAERIANQELNAERSELERREALVTDDEERLLEGLDVLMKSNEELARQHERSLKRARKMESSLGGFATRAEAISRTGQSPSLRESAATLEAEAQGYLTALGQVTQQLESEREAALARALRLRDQLDHGPLRGRKVRVIYDPLRVEDATRVVKLLKSFELDAQLFEAEVEDPSHLKGRLFYSLDEEEAAAYQIARLVEGLEMVEPEKIGVASPYMSLWVVGEPF